MVLTDVDLQAGLVLVLLVAELASSRRTLNMLATRSSSHDSLGISCYLTMCFTRSDRLVAVLPQLAHMKVWESWQMTSEVTVSPCPAELLSNLGKKLQMKLEYTAHSGFEAK